MSKKTKEELPQTNPDLWLMLLSLLPLLLPNPPSNTTNNHNQHLFSQKSGD